MFKFLTSVRTEKYTVEVTLPQINMIADAIKVWKVEHIVDGGSTHEKIYRDMEALGDSFDLAFFEQSR
jgi:hypothetical protein